MPLHWYYSPPPPRSRRVDIFRTTARTSIMFQDNHPIISSVILNFVVGTNYVAQEYYSSQEGSWYMYTPCGKRAKNAHLLNIGIGQDTWLEWWVFLT